jgi:hypothetical protein
VNGPMTLVDRLRIERVLWTVDILIHDIRTRGRRTIRRELRANLQAAAQEKGVGAAIRRLGPLRPLARGYLDAQYGEGARRPRWMGALWWVFVCAILINAILDIGVVGFREGVQAANPNDNGTYLWNQLSALGLPTARISLVDGRPHLFEVSLPWVLLLYLAAAAILGGRLWRLVPRRHPRGTAI